MLRLSILAAIAAGLVACSSETADLRAGECEDYCDLMNVHCTGTRAQYGDRDSCLSTCEVMPLGTPTVHTGNTIACRTFNAAAAELDPTLCTVAGPGGDGGCGTNCESFCAIADEICSGANQIYESVDDCMTACAAFNTSIVYDISKTTGDSLACRIYHLTAASNDPATHCVHIAPISPPGFCSGEPT